MAAIVVCVVVFLGLSGTVMGQADGLFETASVESRLTRKLNLTQNDLRSLRPLIESESDDLLLLYGYYVDQGNSDFLSLWNAVRSRQFEFQSRSFGKLTPRQKRALTLARYEFEAQILDQWLDDYLQMLTDELELDLVRVKYVQVVFDVEHQERLEILRKEAVTPVRLDALWQKLSDDRERKMKRILDDSQWRTYHRMTYQRQLVA
jgi:hypothetical protein